MDWEAIGAIGEIIGAIAVVATLAYLAKQQKQANRVANANFQMGILNRASLNQDVTLSSEKAAEFLVEMRKTPYEQLNELQMVQLEAYAYRKMNLYASVQASHDQGLIPELMIKIYVADLENELSRYPALTTVLFDLLKSYPGILEWQVYKPLSESDDA
ncbi:hypothetical protein R0135_01280 [Congregibacter variabilis]|uniref:DUF4760 domain-containing protein n=1 Tax=Congregibacter variabilis TaxID=3081200 RepID=A0ABZ0I3S2_9GAMM|nr:hypothetical protein R0135_01280 [Congregibacter sp. IMCC43200]